MVGLGIFLALAFSSRHTASADVRSTAESIARSEMEYIKNLTYDATHNPPVYTPKSMADLGVGTTWTITTAYSRLDPKGDGTTNDDGLQKISITVNFQGTAVLTVEGYKLAG